MLQEWADMVDAWVQGRRHVAVLQPPAIAIGPLSREPEVPTREAAKG